MSNSIDVNVAYGLTTPAYFEEKFTPFGVTFKNYIFELLYFAELLSDLSFNVPTISIRKFGGKFKIAFARIMRNASVLYTIQR